jgi:type VI secretion system secreted protein VgrG
MDRQATLSVALGTAKLHLERFESIERLSEPCIFFIEGFYAEEVEIMPHLGKQVYL